MTAPADGTRRPRTWPFAPGSAEPLHSHTLAMLGLQRDSTIIAAFVRVFRRRILR